MPELQEVETIRLQLDRVLPGLKISQIQILKQKSFIGDKKNIIGEKIEKIRRFGKLLVIDLSNGLSLAIHLKMSGQLVYKGKKQPHKLNIIDPLLKALPNKHTRVVIKFSNKDRLYFNDLRIFGWIRILRNNPINTNNPVIQLSNLDNLIKDLGPEPLRNLTSEKFKNILKSSNKPIKFILMDQERLSGVGNIYSNEALFLAKIDPRGKAKELSDGSIASLFHCLERVLRDGIKWGGASSNNYINAFGIKGKAQDHFLVYQKEGQDCPNRCGEKIKRIKLGGRGTFFCPKCQ